LGGNGKEEKKKEILLLFIDMNADEKSWVLIFDFLLLAAGKLTCTQANIYIYQAILPLAPLTLTQVVVSMQASIISENHGEGALEQYRKGALLHLKHTKKSVTRVLMHPLKCIWFERVKKCGGMSFLHDK
jgi:hypothetical protein